MITVEVFYEAVLHLFHNFSEIIISSTKYSDCSKKILTYLKLKCRNSDLRNLKRLYKLWSQPNVNILTLFSFLLHFMLSAQVKAEIKKILAAKLEACIQNQVDSAEIPSPSVTRSDIGNNTYMRIIRIVHPKNHLGDVDMVLEEQEIIEESDSAESSGENKTQV